MMLGADEKIYWVELSTKDEVLDDEPFSKIVRLGNEPFSIERQRKIDSFLKFNFF